MRLASFAAALWLLPFAAHAQPVEGNAEMAAIFTADQAARTGTSLDREALVSGDAARRKRTRELLDQGALTTCRDFYGAAFVFQHGTVPEDYLLAHVLATRSLALGCGDAEWIAAATLDRYLQNTGKSQVYGTQYMSDPENGATMEPYDRTLLTDQIREAAGTHSLADQEARLPEMQRLLDALLPPAPVR